ncbi:hypothetical protein EVAR_34747_1 [Eumeta japonica]|uniref:Uncharacterized protein n=1 Tax=Eumeta variegata TaxID=151549 RepID=A0A4C1YJZ5_EUMVA|nr:hypothetical protein EVAR_34747_1 [Eumeta japonica]
MDLCSCPQHCKSTATVLKGSRTSAIPSRYKRMCRGRPRENYKMDFNVDVDGDDNVSCGYKSDHCPNDLRIRHADNNAIDFCRLYSLLSTRHRALCSLMTIRTSDRRLCKRALYLDELVVAVEDYIIYFIAAARCASGRFPSDVRIHFDDLP